MKAAPGDRIVIRAHHQGEPVRDGEILAVEGVNGAPPYRVRWSEDGHESLFFPGSDAHIEHLHRPRRTAKRTSAAGRNR